MWKSLLSIWLIYYELLFPVNYIYSCSLNVVKYFFLQSLRKFMKSYLSKYNDFIFFYVISLNIKTIFVLVWVHENSWNKHKQLARIDKFCVVFR